MTDHKIVQDLHYVREDLREVKSTLSALLKAQEKQNQLLQDILAENRQQNFKF